MITLALVLTALLFCGVRPTAGYLASVARGRQNYSPAARCDADNPAFVYLVPIVMLFGIGNVPGRGGNHYLRPAADCASDHSGD
jgi:ABC-type proline/glycine betaine transport system permease subunit